MWHTYAEILKLPGAAKFSIFGLIYRYPMALIGISNMMMLPILYGNYTVAGQVAAVGVVAFSVCAPIIARLVDRFGQARVMFPCLTIATVTLIIFMVLAFMRANPWWLYLFIAISGGTSGSAGSLVRARWSLVVANASQLRSAFALEAAWDELAFMTGPILATLLTISVHPLAGLALAVVCSIVGGVVFLSQRDTEPKPHKPQKHQKGSSLLTNPTMLVLIFVYVGAGVIFGLCDIGTVAFSREHGQPGAAGVALGLFAAGSFISALLYGARNWRTPLWKLFAVGITMLAVGVSLFILAKNVYLLSAIMFITGFSISPTMTNVNAIIEKTIDHSRLTEGLTWMTTAMNIGVAGGSALAGRLIDQSGAHLAFWAIVITAWVMFALMVAGLRQIRRADLAGPPPSAAED